MLTDYIDELFDDFIELHGDRYFGDDHAILGGIGYFGGTPVTVIGHRKGRTIEQNMDANFGMAHPEGYRKALRLAHEAEKFHRPVINFVDTGGAFCGVGAEERGQGEAIARCLYEFIELKTPVISIVTGEGGSGGALALAVADRVLMLENALYSVISPRGCASILWKDPTREAGGRRYPAYYRAGSAQLRHDRRHYSGRLVECPADAQCCAHAARPARRAVRGAEHRSDARETV